VLTAYWSFAAEEDEDEDEERGKKEGRSSSLLNIHDREPSIT
jgi:hypothetical protein